MWWVFLLLLTPTQARTFPDLLGILENGPGSKPKPIPQSPPQIDQGPPRLPQLPFNPPQPILLPPPSPSPPGGQGSPRPPEPSFRPPKDEFTPTTRLSFQTSACTCVPDLPSVPPLPLTQYTTPPTQYLPITTYTQSSAPSTTYTTSPRPPTPSTQYPPVTTYAEPTAPVTSYSAPSTQATAPQTLYPLATQPTVLPTWYTTSLTQSTVPPTRNPPSTSYTQPTTPPTRYTASPTASTLPQTQYPSMTQPIAPPTYTPPPTQPSAPPTQSTGLFTHYSPATTYFQPTVSPTLYTALPSSSAYPSTAIPDITTSDGVQYTIARCITVLNSMADESEQRNRNNANLFRRGARALQLTRNLYFDSYTLRQIQENMSRLKNAASQYNSQCRRNSLHPNSYARLNSVFNVNDSWFNFLNLLLPVARLQNLFDAVSTCIEDYCRREDQIVIS